MRISLGFFFLVAGAILSLIFQHGHAFLGTLLFAGIVGVGATLLGGIGGVICAAMSPSKHVPALFEHLSLLPAVIIILVATAGFSTVSATLLMAILIVVFSAPVFGQFTRLAQREIQSPSIQVIRQNGVPMIDIVRQYLIPLLAQSLYQSCAKLCAWTIVCETSLEILGLDSEHGATTLATTLMHAQRTSEFAILSLLSILMVLALYVLTPNSETT